MDPTNWWMQQAGQGQQVGQMPGQGGGVLPQMFGGMPMGTQTNIPPPPQVPPSPPAGPQLPVGGMFGGSGVTQQPPPGMPQPNSQRDQIALSMMQQAPPNTNRFGYGGF